MSSEVVDSVLLGVVQLGFNVEDYQAAKLHGCDSIQSAVEWILDKVEASKRAGQLRTSVTDPSVAGDVNLKDFSEIEMASSFQPRIEQPVSSSGFATSNTESTLLSRFHRSAQQEDALQRYRKKEQRDIYQEAKRRRVQQKEEQERLRRQIAEDRERQRMLHSHASSGSSSSAIHPLAERTSSQLKQKQRTDCLLQVRLPDGRVVRKHLSPSNSLRDFIDHVAQLKLGIDLSSVQLAQPFPARHFTADEMSCSLVELGLTPSACLVLQAVKTRTKTIDSVLSASAKRAADDEVSERGEGSDTSPSGGVELECSGDPLPDEDDEVADIGHPPIPGWDLAPNNPDDDDDNDSVSDDDEAFQEGAFAGEGYRLGGEDPKGAARSCSPPDQHARQAAMFRDLERAQRGTAKSNANPKGLQNTCSTSLVSLCLEILCSSLPTTIIHHPKFSCAALPAVLAERLIAMLVKKRRLNPKLLTIFQSCRVQKLIVDGYSLCTNELLLSLKRFSALRVLSLKGCSVITDAGLSVLQGLHLLRHIDLCSCRQVSDRVLPHIHDLRDLQHILLNETRVTDDGVCLYLLADRPSLRTLSVCGTRTGDKVVQAVCQSAGNLRALLMDRTNVTSLSGVDSLHNLRRLSVAYCPLSESSLRFVRGCRSLRTVSLHGCSIPVDSLQNIRYLALTRLHLPSRLLINDKALWMIARMPLEELDLTDFIYITDDGLRCLQQMSRHLTRLWLSNTKLTDIGMAYVAVLKQLRILSLDRTAVTSKGAECLEGLCHLEELSLSQTRVGNRFLMSNCLNGFTQLAKLNLSKTRISNKGLQALCLPNLTLLNISWTRATHACQKILTKGCPYLYALRSDNICQAGDSSESEDGDGMNL